jgi:hypothetical protein
VSLSVAPVTPKLAVAIVGGPTDTVADMDAPLYDAVTVPGIVPPTVLVKMVKVALVAPASTMTLDGTVSGSVLVNATTAPPVGAAPERTAVPVTDVPPVTVAADTVSAESAARAVTVNVGGCVVAAPLIDAVIVVVPGDTAVTVKVPLVTPAAIVSVAGTVATAGLLLTRVTVPPGAVPAVVSVTVPVAVPPAATLMLLSVTAMAVELVPDGAVELPPHWTVTKRARTDAASVASRVARVLICVMRDHTSTTVPRLNSRNQRQIQLFRCSSRAGLCIDRL